jgi:Schlafen, AlbA_2
MPDPDIAAIEAGAFVEGQNCDFKREVNVDEQQGKIRFLDDVVAFLNRGPAHIFIGVREKGGKFAGFAPMNGNPDQFEQRLLSIVQTGVHPTPLDVTVRTLAVGSGWIADVDLPRHENGPFQNAQTGAFLLRTGSKNTPILRDALQSYFVKNDEWLAEVARLSAEESDRMAGSGRMADKGPHLQIGILPRQHFDSSTPMFTQGPHWRHTAPAFGGHGSVLFQGSEVGHEAVGQGGDGRGVDRLLVRDDWFVHAYIAWPMRVTVGEDRLTFHEFKEELPIYLAQLDEFFAESKIEGPFAVTMALQDLQRDATLGRYFRGVESVRMIRPKIVAMVGDTDLVTTFLAQVRRTTIYG